MATRTPEFLQQLYDHPSQHPFPQNGEGLCWYIIIQMIMQSKGQSELKVGDLIKDWNVDHVQGADYEVVEKYLQRSQFKIYEEQNCGPKRLRDILSLPTDTVDVVASVTDSRVSPGYTKKTDPPEEHSVLLLNYWQSMMLDSVFSKVEFYDPSTHLGGLKRWSMWKWMRWWHDTEAKGWLVVIGMNKDEVYSRIGPPKDSRG